MVYFLLVLVIYLFDQTSKFFIRNDLVLGESLPVINGFFHITLVHNRGAAFGMLERYPGLFSVIGVFSALLIILLLTVKKKTFGIYEKLGLSFILSGTLGNLTDRLFFGYVIDFIDFRIWPVFNIADSFITTGALILGISLLFRSHNERSRN